MATNSTLEQHLLSAAAKALGMDIDKLIPKSAVKKADSKRSYSDYDMTLGQFYVPGRTQKDEPSEEHKLLAGLKVMAEKLQNENTALRRVIVSEVAKAEEKGFEKGLSIGQEEGYKKGKSEALSGVNGIKTNVSKVLQEFENNKAAILHNAEGKILELALSASEAILGKEIESSTDTILQVVKKALAEISSADTVTLRVNPNDIEGIEEGRGFWQEVTSNLKEIKIEKDSRVNRGGCIVESQGGSVDARIDTQIKAVRTLFLKHWRESCPEKVQ